MKFGRYYFEDDTQQKIQKGIREHANEWSINALKY